MLRCECKESTFLLYSCIHSINLWCWVKWPSHLPIFQKISSFSQPDVGKYANRDPIKNHRVARTSQSVDLQLCLCMMYWLPSVLWDIEVFSLLHHAEHDEIRGTFSRELEGCGKLQLSHQWHPRSVNHSIHLYFSLHQFTAILLQLGTSCSDLLDWSEQNQIPPTVTVNRISHFSVQSNGSI